MKVHESVNLVQHEEVRNTSNISNIITHLIISIYTQIKHSTSIEYNVVDQPIPAQQDPSSHFNYLYAIVYPPHPEYVVAESPPW